MNYIIDRFEGIYAVCEDEERQFVNIEKTALPAGAREGSSISVSENGDIFLVHDIEREKRIADKMQSVWE